MDNNLESAQLVCEPEAHDGVRRVVAKVADDFVRIGRPRPVIETRLGGGAELPILVATLGKSPLLDELIAAGKYSPHAIAGKREVYEIALLDDCLLIVGSDKRGTIYGAFALSEYIGVSPLYFWGDVEPVARTPLVVTDKLLGVSKEPSVKFRGFFINDEWPCFGNWTFDHFGGFTAEMYDHVFELLLRLKGNYLWPAMWTSSFALDGPGSANEELADIYGVVIGASHHEPCLRASEEWDLVSGPNSPYGAEWNWNRNSTGLLNYWRDGLVRSGKYEKLITLGMRGERDSAMGADWTLADNIDSLKEIIAAQRELIHDLGEPEPPELLAVYKEVEEYFYGDANTPGLRDWPGLDGVTLMLCEDNFGFLRSLPTATMRAHPGGYGMYYHFDYHGGPVSYEWLPSTTFERTWEQMSQAYDYGIRDVWIVNVGDLKFNEVLLSYFLSLAYDFDRWGSRNPNSVAEYTAHWLANTFPQLRVPLGDFAEVLHGYLRLNAMRRPEAQNAFTYDPAHYQEAERILAEVERIDTLNERNYAALSGAARDAYYSLIYWPAKASLNLLRMNLCAGINRHYADQGKPIANKYAEMLARCIRKDKKLTAEFSQFRAGKWCGMELAPHVGFTSWNEDGSRYPVEMRVTPVAHPRLSVSRADASPTYHKTYGRPVTVPIADFVGLPNIGAVLQVVLEVANDGTGELPFSITVPDAPWLAISPTSGVVQTGEQVAVCVQCDPVLVPEGMQSATAAITAGDAVVELAISASVIDVNSLPRLTFMPNCGVVAINSEDYCAKHDVVLPDGSDCGFGELANYGRTAALSHSSAMKVSPATASFEPGGDAPSLTYRVLNPSSEADSWAVEVWLTPTNPVTYRGELRFTLSTSAGKRQILTAVNRDFAAGDPDDPNWANGVIDNIRVVRGSVELAPGVCEITIGALEPGLIVERILLYRPESPPMVSYLGPQSSFHTAAS